MSAVSCSFHLSGRARLYFFAMRRCMYGRLCDPSLLIPLLKAFCRNITCLWELFGNCLGNVWDCLGVETVWGLFRECFGTVLGLFGGCLGAAGALAGRRSFVRAFVRTYIRSTPKQSLNNPQTHNCTISLRYFHYFISLFAQFDCTICTHYTITL